MGHSISGVIGNETQLRSIAVDLGMPGPVRLTEALMFLPVDDDGWDLSVFMSPAAIDDSEDDSFGFGCGEAVGDGCVRMTTALDRVLISASVDGPIAWIRTEYHGGTGGQGAVVYDRGAVVFGPTSAEYGPINQALSRLGVACAPGQDEFATVGLGRFRSNEDGWAQAAGGR